MQGRYDGQDIYYLVFYEFTTDDGYHFEPLMPDEPVGHLAAQYGVTIEPGEDLTDILHGSRAAILDFLLAHWSIRFDSADF